MGKKMKSPRIMTKSNSRNKWGKIRKENIKNKRINKKTKCERGRDRKKERGRDRKKERGKRTEIEMERINNIIKTKIGKNKKMKVISKNIDKRQGHVKNREEKIEIMKNRRIKIKKKLRNKTKNTNIETETETEKNLMKDMKDKEINKEREDNMIEESKKTDTSKEEAEKKTKIEVTTGIEKDHTKKIDKEIGTNTKTEKEMTENSTNRKIGM
jgi:hypothetical protein